MIAVYRCLIYFFTLLTLCLLIIVPLEEDAQYVLGVISILIFFVANLSKSSKASMLMIIISLAISTRYLWWRATNTLEFTSWPELILGYGLFFAEVYVWVVLLLGYLQTSFLLKRDVVPLPSDPTTWPSVDIYIPTYNESLDIVRDTILAAQCMDYPEDKKKIYLLDDGRREEFHDFCKKSGVEYLTRDNNFHAKAGNLNNAIKKTKGEYICVFDCDHVATRFFLQSTLGGLIRDPKLALIQTPHYFYTPDPFERNLSTGKLVPNEGELFYGPVQEGNDFWNATFFCGSCAVIRREAIESIGGFATETVTEDAHTALRMQRKGWKTAFLKKVLVAGLATERLSLHVIQRTRWARGMTQILRIDNPLLGRGLSVAQRLCYLNAMLHFQFALPRIIFLTAPLAFLLFNMSIISASAWVITSYVLPHLILSIMLNNRLTGRFRYTFWGEIYETVMSFHLVLPTFVTIISPTRGKFNVTDKGSTIKDGFFDYRIVRPHLICALLLFVGVGYGIARLLLPSAFSVDAAVVILNVSWAVFNLFILFAAIAVARESVQKERHYEIKVIKPAVVNFNNGEKHCVNISGLSLRELFIDSEDMIEDERKIVSVEVEINDTTFFIPVNGICQAEGRVALKFDELDISQYRALVYFVMGNAKNWEKKEFEKISILRSIYLIVKAILNLFRRRKG